MAGRHAAEPRRSPRPASDCLQRHRRPRRPYSTMRNSGTRQDDVVIWFECYSKATDSDCARSYNTAPSGANGDR